MSKIIAIFGRGILPADDEMYKAAYQIAHHLAKDGFTIMTGGYHGTMEAASKGAVDAGGHTIGITCDEKSPKTNEWVKEEIRYPTIQDRLNHLVKQADGYVILPGAIGTYLEIERTLTLMSKGEIPLRPIILYSDYWHRTTSIIKQQDKLGNQLDSQIHTVNLIDEVMEILQKIFSD